MKKRLQILIAAALALLLVWGILFAVDFNAVMDLRAPVIARHIGAEGGTYIGPGWRVELEKIHVTENGEDMGWHTVSAEMYLFGILVAAAIT